MKPKKENLAERLFVLFGKDMSRIGKKLILIPENVKAELKEGEIFVHGPMGDLSLKLRPEVRIEILGTELRIVEVEVGTKESGAYAGMTRALIANMITGVLSGFEKRLEMIGVGYRAKESATGVTLSLGFSHPIEFISPAGIKIGVEENTKILIQGVDKHLVGQVAEKIRQYRKPEPYKGKGIRYVGEVVRRKPGKAGKTQ